ncbi:MAG: hypothetical protein OWV35_13320, partial [Firmicutes bacterium]|nr:hypothetical protein [Bacillota bacterium]
GQHHALFTPTAQSPPSATAWSGPLQLTHLQWGMGGAVTEAGSTVEPGGPYVAGTLQVPYTLYFFGLPLHTTLSVWRVERIWGLGPSGFSGE